MDEVKKNASTEKAPGAAQVASAAPSAISSSIAPITRTNAAKRSPTPGLTKQAPQGNEPADNIPEARVAEEAKPPVLPSVVWPKVNPKEVRENSPKPLSRQLSSRSSSEDLPSTIAVISGESSNMVTRSATPRPGTPVQVVSAPSKINSPTPRRVLTITSTKKAATTPEAVHASEAVSVVSSENKDISPAVASDGDKGKAVDLKKGVKPDVKAPSDKAVAVGSDAAAKKITASTPIASPKAKKRATKNKAVISEQKEKVEPKKDKPAESTPAPEVHKAEPEVEAIVSRKTKKRKEKKIVAKPVAKPQPAPSAVTETPVTAPITKEKKEAVVAPAEPSIASPLAGAVVADSKPPAGNDSAKTSDASAASKVDIEEMKAAAVVRELPVATPLPSPPPPRSDSRRQRNRNQRSQTSHEVDITALFTSKNPQTGEYSVDVDTEAIASAVCRLTAGWNIHGLRAPKGQPPGTMNVRIDLANGDGRSFTNKSTPALRLPNNLDLATVDLEMSQLEHLVAATMESWSEVDHKGKPSAQISADGPPKPANQGRPSAQISDGTVNVNVNGVKMNIDANVFIDQALDSLATTAAALYEGLEAQAEKVRSQEELCRNGCNHVSDDGQPTSANMHRVAEQVTRLEEYANKLHDRLRGGTAEGAVDPLGPSPTKKRKNKSGQAVNTRYTATVTVSGGPSTSDVAPMGAPDPATVADIFGVGLNPVTATWTTEDWKAKCKSVEIVMKRVREAREARRRQKEAHDVEIAGTANCQQSLNMLEAFSQAAMGAINGLEPDRESDHDECPSCMNYDMVEASADDAQSISTSEYATPTGDDEDERKNLFEGDNILRLLETVRLLVSNGEQIANMPSPLTPLRPYPANHAKSANKKKKKKATATPQQRMSLEQQNVVRQRLVENMQHHRQDCHHSGMFAAGILFDSQGHASFVDQNGRLVSSAEASAMFADASGHALDMSALELSTSSELSPIVIDPAPLIEAVRNGTLAPGVPIPWETLGLQYPTDPPEYELSTQSPAMDNSSIDVRLLERELELSRKEERELEKQLHEIVRRNRAWQQEVADALELEDDDGDDSLITFGLDFDRAEFHHGAFVPETDMGIETM
ncbi:hypothetical protein BC832DRAFT_387099 [Gaertneriomyces semiglobifer]|nr:hypothetical protein BC832DRAFT_387099 [Gaertneriomyces semiglobifer]